MIDLITFEEKAKTWGEDFYVAFMERSYKRRECFPEEEADRIAYNDTVKEWRLNENNNK